MYKLVAIVLAIVFLSSPLAAERCWSVKSGERITCEALDCTTTCNEINIKSQTPDGEEHETIYCLCNQTSSPCCVGGFYDGIASSFGVCGSPGCPSGQCTLQINNTPEGQKVSAA